MAPYSRDLETLHQGRSTGTSATQVVTGRRAPQPGDAARERASTGRGGILTEERNDPKTLPLTDRACQVRKLPRDGFLCLLCRGLTPDLLGYSARGPQRRLVLDENAAEPVRFTGVRERVAHVERQYVDRLADLRPVGSQLGLEGVGPGV